MLEGLNPQQREAVLRTEGPLLLIAGAGSGKTRVLTTRIAHLVCELGVGPEAILAFTFTNKAAREMQERVARFAPSAAGRAWIGTFHATGARILRQQAHRLGYPNQFTIYDSDDSRSLLNDLLKQLKLDPKTYSTRGVAAEISRWKNGSISPAEALAEALTPRDQRVAELYAAYEKGLRDNGAMDFDDLIGRTVELFETHRDVQERYSERFRYVLVDEFQDTNPLQLLMIRALSARHGNLFAVGDDDQAIYSWRGATVENMLEFDTYFPGAALLRLEQNYRSTSLILRAANELIAHNRRRKGKTLWSEREGGDPIELWWCEDEEDEGRRITERLRVLLGEQDVARKDCVVLYRTNAQSRAVEDALRREGMPYQIVGGTRFYERREVRDLLAYLKVIVNPADTVSLARILNVPRRGVGKTSVERFFGALAAYEGNFLALCRDRGALQEAVGTAATRRLLTFGELLQQLQRLAEAGGADSVLEQLVKAVKYEEWLEKDDPATAADRRENVAELVNAAHAFARESDEGRLPDFLESVALLADVDRMEATGDMVTLMTMHNAKGLEFPVVFVAGCEEGLLPHANSMDEDDKLEEERRLFYVGLTRAQDRLLLTYAGDRLRWGSREPALPSRFLQEIPEDCRVEMSEPLPRLRAGLPFGAPGLPTRPPLPGRSSRGKRRPSESAADTPWDLGAGVEAFRRSGTRGRSKKAGHGFDDHELSQEEIHFRRGLRVHHENLGEGTIEEVEGTGELTRLTIRFGEAGRKRILARYARLTVLDEGECP